MLKTKDAEKFETVNPRIKKIEDLYIDSIQSSKDTIYTFEEPNFNIQKDSCDGKFVYKKDFTESQFNFLRNTYFLPHRLFVTVLTRPNLKDGNQFTMYAGMKQYKMAFDGDKTFLDQGSYYLEYPERWLNIIEQRLLYPALLLTYPNCSFHIITHSVYLIQCTKSENMGVINSNDIVEDKVFNYNDFINGNITSCDKCEEDGGLKVFT